MKAARLIHWVCLCALSTAALSAPVLFDVHGKAGGRLLARPIETGGSAPVPMSESGLAFLRQPCRFSGGIAREGWDLPVNLDLRSGRGIQLLVRCRDRTPISYFACYFKSGSGWYRGEFSVKGTGRWETVNLLKSETGIEGTPAGWNSIEKIRICAWANNRKNTSFDLGLPTRLEADLSVLIARGSSVAGGPKADELGLVTRQAKLVASLLEANGVTAAFMEDGDLASGIPKGVRVLILPYNPVQPEGFEDAVLRFHSRGGGLVGFYSISQKIQAATGIRNARWISAEKIDGGLAGIALVGKGLAGAPVRMPQTSWNTNVLMPSDARARVAAQWSNNQGKITAYPALVAGKQAIWMAHILRNADADAGGKLLLAMVGYCYPGIWRQAVLQRLNQLGRGIHPSGFSRAVEWLDATAGRRGNAEARKYTAYARGYKEQALKLLAAGNSLAALDNLQAAENTAREAFFRVQPSVPGEFRGVWCHRAYGVSGWSWETSVRQLKASGFTAVMPNVANASEAWYPSARLSPPPSVKDGKDYLLECLAATRKYGLECHPWMICFRLDDTLSADSLRYLKAAGRLQKNPSGQDNPGWLCPTNPLNRAQMLGVAAEILQRYPVDGLHLDFIRLPGSQYCFCPHCRDALERHLDRRVKNWPEDVLEGGGLRDRWLDFRAGVITAFVKDAADVRNRIRPAAKLSAAVYADAASARKSVAQDWPAWARLGILDFVCPMDYTSDESHLEQMVARQLGLARNKIPVYPGLGLSAEGLDGIQLVKQVGVTRRARTGGFMVFEFDREEALGALSDLGKGLTRP